jgi:hypothetical protein
MRRCEFVKIPLAGALGVAVVLCVYGAARAATHSPHVVSGAVVHAASAASQPGGDMPQGAVGQALSASESTGRGEVSEPMTDREVAPGTTPFAERPWIEGYEPLREDELFHAAYPVLPKHNILKVFVSDAGSYEAAGIRFSARVPHTMRDLDEEEMEQEAATLVRTAFERFPDLQTVDVWATIPADKVTAVSTESTVFSVSADRTTYLAVRDRGLADEAFLSAFGRVWISPQVPR